MIVVELSHPTDPRYLLVEEPPERVTLDDLAGWRYGKPLLFAPAEPAVVYTQPGGPGTVWVRP